jgi:hypothetical protein
MVAYFSGSDKKVMLRIDEGQSESGDRLLHRRAAEYAELAQRKDVLRSLRCLCVLCASAVKEFLSDKALLFHDYHFSILSLEIRPERPRVPPNQPT